MFQILSALLLPLVSAQYTATYLPNNTPDKSEAPGQIGTNQCGTASSQDSLCQNVYVNSVDDFCLWGPPYEGSRGLGDGTNKIGNIEQIVVAYCLKDGYGTRLIPQGTITAAHFVKVRSDKVSYVQVTGSGDLTKMGLVPNDDGGELDPHSWTGLGNPEGGLVFTNAFGSYQQTHEWTSFMSSNDFCIRACVDGPNAPAYCQHIYDVLSCGFTIPGSFDPGFDNCEGEPTDEAPGVYSGSTFRQGDPTTPAPHPAGPTSQCTPFSTIGGGSANLAAMPTASASSSASASASSNSSMMSNSTISSSSMSMSANSSSSMSMSSGSASASSSASGPARSTSSSSSRSGSPSSTASVVDAASASTSPNAAGKVEMRGMLGMGGVVAAGILGGLMVLA